VMELISMSARFAADGPAAARSTPSASAAPGGLPPAVAALAS
jgi:hypothetical protein